MYAVIVENDGSKWDDQTGIAYHFPKRYINLLQPNTQVIYYKGQLRDKTFQSQRLSDEPHYFGTAKIGGIYEDKSSLKGDKFAVIEDFVQFDKPVPLRFRGKLIEHIPKNRKSNYWRDGVRVIDKETFERIISLTSLKQKEDIAGTNSDSSLLSNFEGDLESYFEGDKHKKYVTQYERNPKLRKLAILIHGCNCIACGFNFEEVYGEHGKNFIHVHHLKPISEFEKPRKVNPETDLTVLCPNCHSMVHRCMNRTLSLQELRQIVEQNTAR